MSQTTKIFISYCHADDTHFNVLMSHLNSISKFNNIEIFTDQQIDIGQDLDETIQHHLQTSDMVLCLVSKDYLNSEYCVRKELEVAIEKQLIDNTKIFPVIAEECLWKRTYFGTIKCAPKDGGPVSKYEKIDAIYLDVVDQLMNQIDKNRASDNEKKRSSSTKSNF